MKSKINRILIIAIIVLLGIGMNTAVYGIDYDQIKQKSNTEFVILGYNDRVKAEKGWFTPHKENNAWVYCSQHGTRYGATLMNNDLDKYGVDLLKVFGMPEENGEFVVATQGPYCTASIEYDGAEDTFADEYEKYKENESKWYSMEYSFKEAYTLKDYQDIAYSFAFIAESGDKWNLDDIRTQLVVWASTINEGKDLNEKDATEKEYNDAIALVNEAKAYKNFYESIHDEDDKDIFNKNISVNTNKANVGVDNGYYIVGPFTVKYPDGQYDDKNKFSWINDIVGVTETGATVEVELLDENGNKIKKESIGINGEKSLNGEKFYIKFQDKTAKEIKLKVDFGYIESCYAEMSKYEGVQYYWFWRKETISEKACYVKEYTGKADDYDMKDHVKHQYIYNNALTDSSTHECGRNNKLY